MLIKKYHNKIYHSVLPVELINPFPTADDRKKWNSIDKSIQSLVKENGEIFRSFHIKPLKGTILLDSIKSGDNSRCLDLFTGKINALSAAVLEECVSGNGELIERILDVSWSIMDMAIWYLPNNSDFSNDSNKAYAPVLDQISAKIGGTLSYSYYLFNPLFGEIDENIGKRFCYEITKRIVDPFFSSDRSQMKDENGYYYPWVPECITYVLFSLTIFEKYYVKKHGAYKKSMIIIDEILENTKYYSTDEQKKELYNGIVKYFSFLNMSTGSAFDAFNDIDDLDIFNREPEKSDCTGKTEISYLEYSLYTGDKDSAEKISKLCSGNTYLKSIRNNLSLDQMLFLIFNSEQIDRELSLKFKGV